MHSGSHSLLVVIHTAELGRLEIRVRDTVMDRPTDGLTDRVTDPLTGNPVNTLPGTQAIQEPFRTAAPVKVAILGAGSAVFSRQLMTDFLCTPGLERGTFCLVDVDAERLELAHRIGEKLVAVSGRQWTNEQNLIIADGLLLAVDKNNELVMAQASRDEYRELGRVKVPIELGRPQQPTIANGRLYLRGKEAVACYQVGE